MAMAMAKAKSVTLSVTNKCRNILAASWEAHLNTIKADAKGSKGEIYTSRVHYMVQKGTPYLIVPENHMHNINIIIDERGSLSVCSPIPGRLTSLLKSLNKLPPRVAMTGDVLRMKETKVPVVADSLKKAILKEHKAASETSYGVSTILSSASATCRSRSEGLLSLLNEYSSYNIFKFEIGFVIYDLLIEFVMFIVRCLFCRLACVQVIYNGYQHKLLQGAICNCGDIYIAVHVSTLIPLGAAIISSWIILNHQRQICYDAFLLSIDHHGFDVIAKVPERATPLDVPQQYHWKEFRFTFKEAAKDVEDFCRMLVELEEEALQSVKSYSGLG